MINGIPESLSSKKAKALHSRLKGGKGWKNKFQFSLRYVELILKATKCLGNPIKDKLSMIHIYLLLNMFE